MNRILWVMAWFLYFVLPVDVIPDIIPLAGWIDDLGGLLWVVAKLRRKRQMRNDMG